MYAILALNFRLDIIFMKAATPQEPTMVNDVACGFFVCMSVGSTKHNIAQCTLRSTF